MPAGEEIDVRIANAKVPDLYDEMVAAAGERNLWVVGGGNVASQFADAGLLDELLVTVVPVVLGDGKPLFDRRLPGGPMKLTGNARFRQRDGRAALRDPAGAQLVLVRKPRPRALPLDLALALGPRALLDAVPVVEHPLQAGDRLGRMLGDRRRRG